MKLPLFIRRSFVLICFCLGLMAALLMTHPSLATTPPTVKPSALRLIAPPPQKLDGEKLQQALDRKDLVDVIRQVELGWQFQYETYYDGRLKSKYLELPEIQQRLGSINQVTKTNSALLYAVPRPNGLNLILVPAQGTPIIKTIKEANAKTLPEVAKNFRLNIVNAQTTQAEYLPPAQQLYQWLIQPIAADLQAQKIDTMIFCLGTGLRGLPLAALHDGQKFLVEQYNLAIIPAFNLLDHRPAVLSGLQVLATGASDFKDNADLPAVPLELETITQKGIWPGQMLLNEAFTLEKFQQARSQTPYGIIHLATHADISAKSVKDSYIQFWDQRLQLNEVRDLKLEMPVVQLLVLSACRTALGTPNAELGFAGLAVQSGAKAVLASLWAVDDVGTLVLMSEFYQQLKNSRLKSTALRQTQIAMLKGNLKLGNSLVGQKSRGRLPEELQPLTNQDLSHPYYWAAFTMIGNPW